MKRRCACPLCPLRSPQTFSARFQSCALFSNTNVVPMCIPGSALRTRLSVGRNVGPREFRAPRGRSPRAGADSIKRHGCERDQSGNCAVRGPQRRPHALHATRRGGGCRSPVLCRVGPFLCYPHRIFGSTEAESVNWIVFVGLALNGLLQSLVCFLVIMLWFVGSSLPLARAV